MLTDGHAEDVFQVGFQKAWQRAVEAAGAIRLPAKCKNCQMRDQCKACAAMVYTESGNFQTVPEYRCRMAHEYPNACRLLEAEIREGARHETK